jgi:hypothetical protein
MRPSPAMAVALLALCVALSGSAVADPIAQGAASLGANVKKALGLAKKADRRSKQALRLARRPGPQGPPGERGLQGPSGSIQGAAAGGDLTGSYPNPSIAADAVGSSEVANRSILDEDIQFNEIKPWHITDGSLTGDDVADGFLTGDDIDESSLAAVPNAQNVDG